MAKKQFVYYMLQSIYVRKVIILLTLLTFTKSKYRNKMILQCYQNQIYRAVLSSKTVLIKTIWNVNLFNAIRFKTVQDHPCWRGDTAVRR